MVIAITGLLLQAFVVLNGLYDPVKTVKNFYLSTLSSLAMVQHDVLEE